jgi:hypothetical protein
MRGNYNTIFKSFIYFTVLLNRLQSLQGEENANIAENVFLM